MTSVESAHSRAGTVRRVAVVLGVIGAALIAQLLLSIGLANGAYEISGLQQSGKELSRQSQQVSEQLAALESPQNLAEQARELGMQPSTQLQFLDLATGATSSAGQGQGVLVASKDNLVANALLNEESASQPVTTEQPQDASGAVQQAQSSEQTQAQQASSAGAEQGDAGDGTSEEGQDPAASATPQESLPQVTLR